jgi:hypothetical protein
MPSGADVQSTAAVWQGPVVRNEETGASTLLFLTVVSRLACDVLVKGR